jgi:hypothetical protein
LSTILSQALLDVRRQFTRQTGLSEFFETLKIIDMAVVNLLAEKGGLATNGRRVAT